MKSLTEKISKYQALIAGLATILASLGLDRSRLLPALLNPIEWGLWEPLFLSASLFLVMIAIWRQTDANSSHLLDPNALKLDPSEPRHLLGRKEDIARIYAALPRSLIFLVGESGSGKTALLQAGIGLGPQVLREYIPVYIDLTDQSWDDGLLLLIRDRFRLALPVSEQSDFAASDCFSTEDLLASFDLYRQKLGRRPLLIFDQFDDYAAHHHKHLYNIETGDWRNTDAVAASNSSFELVLIGVKHHTLTALFVSRREDQDVLETVRTLPKPVVLRLDRPPSGSTASIIDAVSTAYSSERIVIENPGATWPALKRRIAVDIERSGQVLPQQLKLVLQGLRSLPRLTVRAYERAGRTDGLEAASLRDAVVAVARGTKRTPSIVLACILLPLVDADRRPPGKARPRTVAQLTGPGLDTAAVIDLLVRLEDREIVRCAGDSIDEMATWQLDHEYLARPLLRLKAQQDRWAILLAERTAVFQDAGSSLLRRWRSLLSTKEQIGVLIAFLRGRVKYGAALNLAMASLVTSFVLAATPVAVLGAVVWAASQYDEAARIEASLGGMANDFSNDQYSVTGDQRKALLDLENGSLLTRRLVMRDIFIRPQQAAAFANRPADMLLALTGLNVSRTAWFVALHRDLGLLYQTDKRFLSAWIELAKVGAGNIPIPHSRVDDYLDQVLFAIEHSEERDQINDLVQVYKVVAGELTPFDLRKGVYLNHIEAMISQVTDTSRLLALANTAKYVVLQLPATDLRVGHYLDHVLRLTKSVSNVFQLSCLSQVYQAISDKLQVSGPGSEILLDRLLNATEQTEDASSLDALAHAYEVVAGRRASIDSRVYGFVNQILGAIKHTSDGDDQKVLGQAAQTVAGMLPAGDPRASDLLDRILVAIIQATDSWQLNPLGGAFRAIATKVSVVDPRLGAYRDRIYTAAGRTRDTYELQILAEAYQSIDKESHPSDPQLGKFIDVIFAVSKQSLNIWDLEHLAFAYRALADKLPAADPRLLGLQNKILSTISPTADIIQFDLLSAALRAIAESLRPGDPRAINLFEQMAVALPRITSSPEASGLTSAYYAIIEKLSTSDPHNGALLDYIFLQMKEAPRYDVVQLQTLSNIVGQLAGKLAAVDTRSGEFFAQDFALEKRTTDAYRIEALSEVYRDLADNIPDASSPTGEFFSHILVTIEQTTNSLELDALGHAFQLSADKLQKADPRLITLLNQIFSEATHTTNIFQIRALAQCYQAVVGKSSAADPRAGELLEQVLAMTETTPDDLEFDAEAKAIKEFAAKLLPAEIRARLNLFSTSRNLARNRESWGEIVQAELLSLPALSMTESERLISDLLRDPFCHGTDKADVLLAFSERLNMEPTLRMSRSHGPTIYRSSDPGLR